MILHYLHQTPSAAITLTAAEVAAIRTCASMHYDGHCKQSAEPGGFLWGWKNVFEWAKKEGDGSSSVKATFRECDTVLKCLEFSCPEVEHSTRYAIKRFFWDVFTTLNSSHMSNLKENV